MAYFILLPEDIPHWKCSPAAITQNPNIIPPSAEFRTSLLNMKAFGPDTKYFLMRDKQRPLLEKGDGSES